jgi:hypothetical protein
MIPLRRFKLDRRTLLRGLLGGAAVSVALPPLEAMLGTHGDAFAGGEPLPRRFLSFFFGNGVQLDRFEPAATGPGWAVSEQLAPLADVKEHVTVCTGLQNRCQNAITHHEGMTAFSGYTFELRFDLPGFASDWGGPTIDQRIADVIAARTPTPVRSLQVGCSKFYSPADNGTTATVLSVRGEPGNLVPLPPETNPVQVWETLFGEFTAPPDTREMRLSVLDAIRDDVTRLQNDLGTVDRQRLDAHLQGVAELETKIAALPPSCILPAAPIETNDEPNGQEQLALVNQVMAELVAYAFVCDVTRVASNLFLALAGEAVLGEVGAPSTQHVHSHENNEDYHNGIVFIMQRFAEIVRIFRDTPDVDGASLLDSTILFASSDCAEGWSHSIARQPILLAGHGRGHLAHPGIHYQAIGGTGAAGNTADVLLSVLRAFDPAAASVGGDDGAGSSTPLQEILA